MARLGCVCGEEMSNTDAPSKYRINIFYKKEAKEAILNNPQIRLWDFYSGWDEKNKCNNSFQDRKEPVEYWYCPKCRRVYEVQAKSLGKIIRVFTPQTNQTENFLLNSGMDELIVLSDNKMDEFLSTAESMILADYLKVNQFPIIYISNDEEYVYILNDNQKVSTTYKRER